MKAKEFIFTREYTYIADSEEEAIKKFQEDLDDEEIWNDRGLLDANGWNVEVEDVDISEPIEVKWTQKVL